MRPLAETASKPTLELLAEIWHKVASSKALVGSDLYLGRIDLPSIA
jgi:hypothetical protein